MNNLAFIYVAYFGVFILSGLFALFISTRTWPWLLRVAILIVAVVPAVPVDATDLLVILLTSHLVIFSAINYEKFRRSRFEELGPSNKNRLFVLPRFRLIDLMLLLVATCGVFALVSQTTRTSVLDLVHQIGTGCALGVWTLAGVSMVYWKISVAKRLIVVAIGATATLLWAAIDGQWLVNGLGPLQTLLAWTMFLAANAGTILLAVFFSRFGMYRPDDRVRSDRWRWLRFGATGFLALAGVLVASSIMVSYSLLLDKPPTSENARPFFEGEPNGVFEFIDAGRQFDQSPILNTALVIAPGDQMRVEISNFSAFFEKVDLGLTRKNQTWVDWSICDGRRIVGPIFTTGPNVKADCVRSIARALSVRARQSRADGNYDDSLDDGIRSVQVAQSATVDGLFLTWMIGNASEHIGHFTIQSSLKKSSPKGLKEAQRVLNEIEKTAPDVDRIVNNEYYFMWRQYNWKQRLHYNAIKEQSLSPIIENVQCAVKLRSARTAVLRTAVALELYQRDNGVYPDQLSGLFPDYQSELLLDPFATPPRPLRYSPIDDGQKYILYSVGENGVDDDGVVDPNWDFSQGDVNFAELTRLHEAEMRALVGATEATEAEKPESTQ